MYITCTSLLWLCRAIDTISERTPIVIIQVPRLHRVEAQRPIFEAPPKLSGFEVAYLFRLPP